MSKVSTLIRYQWISYWRSLQKTASVSAANQGILLLILVLVVLKYFQLLQVATTNLTRGNTALLKSLLTGIFVGLLFPLTSGTHFGADSRRLLQLPVSYGRLFLVRLVSLLIPPSSWLIVIAALAICYPLAHAPNPRAAIVAGLLFIVMSWQVGVAAANLMSISIARKILVWLCLIVAVIFGIKFSNGFALGDLDTVTRFSPTTLVVEAATNQSVGAALGVMTLLALIATGISFWSFGKSLEAITTRSRTKERVGKVHLPGRLGGLIAKDFRYFRRLLDSYLGVLAAIVCCIHLVGAQSPSADVVRIIILLMFLANSAIAFNLFGLDDHKGLNRYSLFPLTGTAILLSKNLAFLILVAVQLTPVLLLTIIRLGLWEMAGAVVEAFALAAAYLAWGNWMSVSHPVKLQFFRFSSSGSSLADSIGGLIFGSAPGVVAIYGLRNQQALWMVMLVTLSSFVVYLLSLIQFGKRFEKRRETIGAVLA